MSKFGPVGIGITVAFVTVILIELITSSSIFFSLTLGALIGAGVIIFLLSNARGEKPAAVAKEAVMAAKEAVMEPRAVVDERIAYEKLHTACVQLLISGALGAEKPELQNLVTTLRNVLPRAITFSPESETTFNLLKFAKEDLPKQLQAYAELSMEDRASSRATFLSQLQRITEKIGKLADIIDRGRQDQFDAESAFINLKFS